MRIFLKKTHRAHFFHGYFLGFSLIEVMVVIVIISIISAIAIPSYQASIKKGYRTEAMITLEEMTQAMERHYYENNTYGYTTDKGGNNNGAPISSIYPTTSLPKNQSLPRTYTLFIDLEAKSRGYTVKAIAENDQKKDPCGDLSLNHQGIKTPELGTDDSPCW